MPRRGEWPGNRNRKREPKSIDTERELSRPKQRLQLCIERLSNYVKNPPKGINIEALRRYISSGDLAERDVAITDPNNAAQKNFLAEIDKELERKAILEKEIETGVEVLPPVDPTVDLNEEMLVKKISAASQSMIKLGADPGSVTLFLSTSEIHYLTEICVDIKDQPGAKEVMQAFIQTANELFRQDEKPEIIIDIDNLFSLVKVSE